MKYRTNKYKSNYIEKYEDMSKHTHTHTHNKADYSAVFILAIATVAILFLYTIDVVEKYSNKKLMLEYSTTKEEPVKEVVINKEKDLTTEEIPDKVISVFDKEIGEQWNTF